MPLYAYVCKDCDRRTEKISKLDRKLIWCPYGGVAKRVFCADGGGFRKGDGYWADKKQGEN